MPVTPLKRAIELIKQGKLPEAQKLLKPLIAANHHDIAAWFCFVETCSTNKQRLDVLEICLEYNLDNEQVKQELDNLRALNTQQLPTQSSNSDGIKFPPTTYRHSSFYDYLRLIGLSAISGLLLASIILIIDFFRTWELGAVPIWMFLQLVQYLLVIPATFAVYTLDKLTSSKIHFLVRVGIPLIINIIGANSTFIAVSAMNIKNDVPVLTSITMLNFR